MIEAFNLLDEPWIRVTMRDGTTKMVSLKEAFLEGSETLTISGEITAQDTAILRLLLAISHRALEGPRRMTQWREAWGDLNSYAARVATYLELWRSRFDVRDPKQPFFQVAGIHSAKNQPSGLEKLIADVPNGEQFFTTRSGRAIERISWAEASRWLIHAHAFDPSGIRTGAVGDPCVKGGKGYPIGPGWAGQLGVVNVEGESLLETILLNTVVTSKVGELSEVDHMVDLPPWEIEQKDQVQSTDLHPEGPVGCYTWQSRRILLHGDNEGVTGLFLGNGDKANTRNQFSVEPMTAWRFSEPQTKKEGMTIFMPQEHSSAKAFWRGLPSMIPDLTGEPVKGRAGVTAFKPPAVIEFYQVLIGAGVVENTGFVPLHATGYEYGSNQSVINEAFNDVLVLPAEILATDRRDLISMIQGAIKQAESVAMIIRQYTANVMNAQGATPDQLSDARNQAERDYYQTIDVEFPKWLLTVALAPETAKPRWMRTLWQTANTQVESIAERTPATAYVGRDLGTFGRMDMGRANFLFRSSIAKELPYEQVFSDVTKEEE